VEDGVVLELAAMVLVPELAEAVEVDAGFVVRHRYQLYSTARHGIQGNKKEAEGVASALGQQYVVVIAEHIHNKRSSPILGADSKGLEEQREGEEVGAEQLFGSQIEFR
jgi:hypothetical protein